MTKIDFKKRQREKLYRDIWDLSDHLRGTLNGWEFKHYILIMMFYRFVSEKGIVRHGETFNEVYGNARADPDLGATLSKVFGHIEENPAFAGITDDFELNGKKLGNTVADRNDRLYKLMRGVAAMDLGNHAGNVDTFGDAYEIMMSMYSDQAGKSGGEFFTPPEISELMTRLGMLSTDEVRTVYDPACGSGSLLLQASKVLKEDTITGYYGQEINVTTYNLCRINMFLHDVPTFKTHIVNGDTLTNDLFSGMRFDLVVSNPPYSVKWIGDGDKTLYDDPRFRQCGALPPRSRGDLAFVLHCLHHLADDGTAVIACYPGVLFREMSEAKIRQYLVDNNYIDAIIQMPPNTFMATSVSVSLMILKKNKKDSTIWFMNASDECERASNSNRLTQANIKKIIQLYQERKNVEGVAYVATHEDIQNNKYNLVVSTYVDPVHTASDININRINEQLEELVDTERELRATILQIINNINEL